MLDLLQNYDVLGAFWGTIKLSAASAVGALLLGTLAAVMRVSPVAVLRGIGTAYVNIFRNTPLTLLVVFSILGLSLLMGLTLAKTDTGTTNVSANVFRWGVVMLSVYHGAFVCEALRSGVNTVPVGQAEAARAIGLTFGQSMSQVILPQAFRGSVAPLGSVLIALIKNSTVTQVIGGDQASTLMAEMVENETGSLAVFGIFAIGFVILTLPIGIGFTSMSRRLAVKR